MEEVRYVFGNIRGFSKMQTRSVTGKLDKRMIS